MKDTSEDEQEAEFIEPSNQKTVKGKTQSERTEELRKMMDESGIAILDIHYISRSVLRMSTDEEMEDTAEEEPSQNSETIPTPKEPSPEPAVTVTGGRRRGRRKIMKKKTIKDEEGYLGMSPSFQLHYIYNNRYCTDLLHPYPVTKEEPAWESFSEDERAPTKERTPASTAASASSMPIKGKKAGGKPGQGNIMSFFGKK